MTRGSTPPILDPIDSELHALYREGAQAEPSPGLDRLVLDAAHADVAKPRPRPRPWWTSWLAPVSVAAVAVIGLSLTLRLVDEDERRLYEERRAPAIEQARPPKGDDAAPPAMAPAPAESASAAAPAPAAKRGSGRAVESPASPRAVPAPQEAGSVRQPEPAAEKKASAAGAVAPSADSAPAQRDGAVVASPQPHETADAPARRVQPPVPASPPAAAPAMAPAPAAEVMQKRQRATLHDEGDAAAPRRDQSRPVGKAEASSVAPPADAPTPEAWLDVIRELRAAGRVDDAARSLARFRVRYPDHVLPDDLK